MTPETFIRLRDNAVDVTVIPRERWQQIGNLETMSAINGTVTIRWHNGERGMSFYNRPLSTHNISDVVIFRTCAKKQGQ